MPKHVSHMRLAGAAPGEGFAARSIAYNLLARFFREGPTQGLLSELSGLPGVGLSVADSTDPDSVAATHFRVLGLDVLPLASAYLEADGRPGGSTSAFVSRIFLRSGADLPVDEASDHISNELELLSRLCRIAASCSAEADAAGDLVILQRDLLDHLFWWLPVFHHALAGAGHEAYAEMSGWALAIALDHRRTLGAGAADRGLHGLPDSPDLLAIESTGLRDIAEYLVRPALSGVVITRRIIESMARELGVPRGFGDRATMLANVFYAASTYDVAIDLCQWLRTFAGDWRSHYVALADAGSPSSLRAAAAAWLRKLERTLEMLDEVERRASGTPGGPYPSSAGSDGSRLSGTVSI